MCWSPHGTQSDTSRCALTVPVWSSIGGEGVETCDCIRYESKIDMSENMPLVELNKVFWKDSQTISSPQQHWGWAAHGWNCGGKCPCVHRLQTNRSWVATRKLHSAILDALAHSSKDDEVELPAQSTEALKLEKLAEILTMIGTGLDRNRMLRALEYPNGSHLPLALSAAGLGWKTRARKGRGHKWSHHAVCYSDGNMLVTSWDPIYPASSDQREAHSCDLNWKERWLFHVILLTWPNQERGSQLARKAKRLAQVLLAQRLLLGGTRLRWSCRVGWIGSMDVSQNNSE